MMKLQALLLGGMGLALLSGGAQAADVSTLSGFDACDSLGLSGITLSSGTNCLAVSGGVHFKFTAGDYETGRSVFGEFAYTGEDFSVSDDDGLSDYSTRIDTWLSFVASSDSDFGPARAVLLLREVDYLIRDGFDIYADEDDTGGLELDNAYVSIGDSTVLMAGRKSSLANLEDDLPFNFLGLFNSEAVEYGAGFDEEYDPEDSRHVIQIVSDLGNGFSVGAGLEDLESTGTAVGVISYGSDALTGHMTVLARNLFGEDADLSMHAGLSAAFDKIALRAAVAADDDGWWNVLGSAAAVFDIFTLAASAEATSADEYGFGISASAQVTEGIAINAGFRWFDPEGSEAGYQAAAQVVAAVTETIKITGEVGLYAGEFSDDTYYGLANVAWAPGGGFVSSLQGEANSQGAYKVTLSGTKSFE